MTTYTPSTHAVWNELDDIGILLNLPRIDEEANISYKQRLFDVFAHRADSTYTGLINGITRELGLSIYHAMTITPVWNPAGTDYLGDNPAVIFEDTKCYIYSDYTDEDNGLITTLDRYDENGDAWNMYELVQSINSTGYLYAALSSDAAEYEKSMRIFNQQSISLVNSENLSDAAAVINLKNSNLLSNSVFISSPNLRERVETQISLVRRGQYYIDYANGIIYTIEAPAPGSYIRYKYRNDNFRVYASPVILHNLQSDDFKAKLFEQVLTSDGTYTNGLPTELGNDIINELQSVFAMFYNV